MSITNDDLIKWLKEMPVWIKDAVVTYYDSGIIEQTDIIRFADECLANKDDEELDNRISCLNLLRQANNNCLSIKSIGDIQGVNALSSGRKLSFGDKGITVVYGENGAGKSGYIRIIKNISDAKYKEELRRNVYLEDNDEQKCEVKIQYNDEERVLSCNLSKAGEYPILKGIDVFDTRIANAYILSAKEAAYEPWIFILFRELAKTSDRIKDELQARREKLSYEKIDIPEDLIDTKIGKRLNSISSKTEFDEKTIQWDEKKAARLDELKKSVNKEALQSDVKRIASEIRSLKSIKEYFVGFSDLYSDENIKMIEEKKEKWLQTMEEKNAAAILFEQSADDIDKISIGNSAWVSLWKKADEYYKQVLISNGEKKYSETDGICPLCRQTISKERIKRIQGIDTLINGKVSEEEAKSRKQFVDAIVFPNIWGQGILNAVLDACNCSEVKDMATDISNAISMQYLPFLQKKYEEVSIGKIEVDKLIGIIDAVILDRKTEMNSKESLLDDEDTKNRIKDIQELEAVKYGHENIDKIRRIIKNYKSIDTIEKAIKHTNSKKLTIKSKELANELITKDYLKRFNDELGVLTRNSIHVKMEQQAGKGSNPFKIKLVDVMGDVVSPDDILSEGEKRIVALAAFFAESSGRADNTPLIVDDPISSLDYLFEDAVIRRLADISRQRQVIVFTHRLSMLAGLDEQRKNYGVPFCEKRISGKGKIKGVPIDDVEFTGKADKQINHIMNIEVPKLRKTDLYSAEYIKQINYICQQIRIAVEKSVEDILLNGVVVRWRRGIQTLNKLGALANITLDDCKIIDDMMTKYSYYDHSMGDDTPLIDFSADEIQNDLDTFAHWIAEKKKSNNKK